MTKNYPDDTLSDLDQPDGWRLNVPVGTDVFIWLVGKTLVRM